jgi:hypothetical protein
MVISASQTYFIDPLNQQTDNKYIMYFKQDVGRTPSFECGVEDMDDHLHVYKNGNTSVSKTIGTELRTYRLALACTGEYANFHGGTKPLVLAAMTTSMNRVNGVYEREVCIRMNLVPNDTLLIFLDAATDGYDNNSGGAMLSQNQTKCVNIIGLNNFDIGHVFSTGGGGIANLGCVCKSSSKAQGVTGSPSPINDPFDIDYVAHEMGHQFGANHTFNCETGACQGNRAFTAAYEPGSGITIMAYAGICGSSDNLASHSIPTFHPKSFDEITIYSQTGSGNTCAVKSPTGNNPPTMTLQGNYTIPYKTPFRLVALGNDIDGDTITYSWEQYDLGPAGSWNVPVGNAPLWRPYLPTLSGTRLCPKLTNVLNAVANYTAQSKGELRADTARTLKFKCTVRDNRAGGGGVTNNDANALVTLNVINTSSLGFRLTNPNVTGISWPALSWQTITWDVAGTTGNGINCANVNIWLSTDGGLTFPHLQAWQVPNNGSYSCVILNQQSTQCRFMIEGDGNVFFDINDKNFTIGVPTAISENVWAQFVSVAPNPSTGGFQFALNTSKIYGDVTIKVLDINGKQLLEEQHFIEVGNNLIEINLANKANGIYQALIISNNGVAAKRLIKQ